ncbi:MAG TPA: PilZ domain-containing protein [Myxococcota bacterium]|nr:PilZ domain-containing protein [Myxococcota bacterium]
MGTRPAVLLIDDGELDDVAALLAELGPAVFRSLPEDLVPGRGVLDGRLRLIVASGRRALGLPELPCAPTDPEPTRVAVVSGGSRTLRGALRRVGFHYLVHRPVHPDALRLLLTRLLYRGPEKRRAERVAVGAPTSFRAGLRRRSGTLVELSATGCRLVAGVTPARGAQVTVFFPDPDGGRAIPVRGCVLRVALLDRTREIAISFGAQTDAARARIERLVALHRGGPAAWAGSSLPGPGTPSGRRDQRRNRRGVYRKRIIALFEGGARVLLGRDLSVGGMRVESDGDLEGGQIVSLALHGSSLANPVVVRARVVRRGLSRESVLRFIELDDATRDLLAKLVAEQPEIESLGPEGGASGRTVVTTLFREERA